MPLNFASLHSVGRFLVSFLPQLMSAIIALATIRVYSELLSPNQLGEVMLGLGFIALLDALFSASVGQSAFYFTTRPNGMRAVEALMSRSWSFVRWTLIAFPVIAYVVEQGTNIEEVKGLLLATLCALIYVTIEPLRAGYTAVLNASNATKRFGVQVIMDATLILCCSSAALTLQADLIGLIIGVIAARLVSLIIVRKAVSKLSLGSIDSDQSPVIIKAISFKEFFAHAFPFVGMGVVGWASSFADRYAVALTGNVVSAGVYSVAVGLIGRPFNILSSSFTTHFRPQLFSSVAAGDFRSARKYQQQWVGFASVFGLVGAALMWAFDLYIVTILLAEKSRMGVLPLIPILGLAFAVTIVTHAFDNRILASGQGQRLLLVQIMCVPITVIALGIGCYLGGPQGATWGRLISEVVRLAVVIVLSLTHLSESRIVK